MKKEIIITRRSPFSKFVIEEYDLPGEIQQIAVLEFGFDNNIFNITTDNEVTFTKEGRTETFKLPKGHYEVQHIIDFFNNCVSSFRISGKLNRLETVKMVFNKPTLTFKVFNYAHKTVINFSQEFAAFLNISPTIPPYEEIQSYKPFTNSSNRVLYLTCDNIKGGERITNDKKGSKVLLTHYIKSNFGDIEMAEYYKKIVYYNYIFQDNNFKCTIEVKDETGFNIDYTSNTNIFIKLSIICE